mmetsp:Transcript_19386/g.56270  ORF Transcript_19386/g.56270 Transcript_19386/m.56270 type:complete len:97 (-) Transcript_19386:661-951(-)
MRLQVRQQQAWEPGPGLQARVELRVKLVAGLEPWLQPQVEIGLEPQATRAGTVVGHGLKIGLEQAAAPLKSLELVVLLLLPGLEAALVELLPPGRA